MRSEYFPPTIQLSLSTKNASLADSGPVFIGFLCGVASSGSKQNKKNTKRTRKPKGKKEKEKKRRVEWMGLCTFARQSLLNCSVSSIMVKSTVHIDLSRHFRSTGLRFPPQPSFPLPQTFSGTAPQEGDPDIAGVLAAAGFPPLPGHGPRTLEPTMEALPPKEGQPDRFRCSACGQVVSHRNNVSRHRRKCQRVHHLQCPLCGKPFYRRDVYQKHLRTVHRMEDGGDYRGWRQGVVDPPRHLPQSLVLHDPEAHTPPSSPQQIWIKPSFLPPPPHPFTSPPLPSLTSDMLSNSKGLVMGHVPLLVR